MDAALRSKVAEYIKQNYPLNRQEQLLVALDLEEKEGER